MKQGGRLGLAFIGGTLVAFLYAAAVLRVLPAAPQDARSAAGMTLMLLWPTLVVASAIPARVHTATGFLAVNAILAFLLGWTGL